MPRLTHEMGIYLKHGLQTRLTVLESASVATAALISGSVQVTQAGSGELIAAQARGQKVVAIGIAYAGFAQSLVLSKAGITKVGVSPSAPMAERMKALQGLTIATTSATASATIALRKAATQLAGVDVRFTYMTQPSFAAAMTRQAIDGFIGSAPFSTMAISKGLGQMWADGPKRDFPAESAPANAGILLVMRDYADANPDVIRRLRASYGDFAATVSQRPQEVKATIARLFPDLDAPTLDLFFESESAAWSFRQANVDEMAHELRFLKESGISLPGLEQLKAPDLIYP